MAKIKTLSVPIAIAPFGEQGALELRKACGASMKLDVPCVDLDDVEQALHVKATVPEANLGERQRFIDGDPQKVIEVRRVRFENRLFAPVSPPNLSAMRKIIHMGQGISVAEFLVAVLNAKGADDIIVGQALTLRAPKDDEQKRRLQEAHEMTRAAAEGAFLYVGDDLHVLRAPPAVAVEMTYYAPFSRPGRESRRGYCTISLEDGIPSRMEFGFSIDRLQAAMEFADQNAYRGHPTVERRLGAVEIIEYAGDDLQIDEPVRNGGAGVTMLLDTAKSILGEIPACGLAHFAELSRLRDALAAGDHQAADIISKSVASLCDANFYIEDASDEAIRKLAKTSAFLQDALLRSRSHYEVAPSIDVAP